MEKRKIYIVSDNITVINEIVQVFPTMSTFVQLSQREKESQQEYEILPYFFSRRKSISRVIADMAETIPCVIVRKSDRIRMTELIFQLKIAGPVFAITKNRFSRLKNHKNNNLHQVVSNYNQVYLALRWFEWAYRSSQFSIDYADFQYPCDFPRRSCFLHFHYRYNKATSVVRALNLELRKLLKSRYVCYCIIATDSTATAAMIIDALAAHNPYISIIPIFHDNQITKQFYSEKVVVDIIL